LGDEICLKVLAKDDYTRLSNFVKDKIMDKVISVKPLDQLA